MKTLNFNFKNNSYENFNSCAKGKKIILFGTGLNGKLAFDDLSSKFNIEYFIDNDPWLWGRKFCGVDVFSPEILLTEDKQKNVIVITHTSVFEAEESLLSFGCKYYFAYKMFFDKMLDNREHFISIINF